jgi:hypothetical protein
MQTWRLNLMTEFHGWVGHIAILRDAPVRTAKIVGGEGQELYMQDIDGNVFKCYHDNIEYIYSK